MAACASCGKENPEEARFCNACAAPLTHRPPREERKTVTVVFVDIVGFTARSETLDPEDVRGIQLPYFSRVRDEFERFGGRVEKFIGDAVMAVFGAPVAHEDDAERAVRAAIEIRDTLVAAGDLDVRIGVNTGEALVAIPAGPETAQSFVSGDVVNTAARLQAAAAPNTVLVGEPTYRATSAAIEYRPTTSVDARGKAAPVRAWNAIAPRSRVGSEIVGAGVDLVGRRRELDLVLEALGRARSERELQLVTLVGVPGIGKSRLVSEVFRRAHDDSAHITWCQGRCLPYGSGVTFWAVAEVVKAHAGILETDEADEAEMKLRAAIEVLPLDEPAFVLSHLRPLAGIGEAPEGGRKASFAAWRGFFESLAADGPAVLVFEDLHWADDELLAFVEELVDDARHVPILVLCTARPELLDRRRDWGGGKLNAFTLALSALNDDDTQRLVSSLLANARLDVPRQAQLVARAGGNPLYAEQFVRMIGEGGSDIPETVQGIIAARIDALGAEEKSLLHRASVVGKVFWGGAVDGDERVLRALERKDFVRRERRTSVAGQVEYAFTHTLVRDVAYGQIPRSRRWRLHIDAARWIDALSDRGDRIDMVAHHYDEALNLARATGEDTSELRETARWAFREAAGRLWDDQLFPAARSYFESAIQLWPDDEERMWMTARAAQAAAAVGEVDIVNMIEITNTCSRGLRTSGDERRAARLTLDAAGMARLAGHRVDASKIDDAREMAERSGDKSAVLEAWGVLVNDALMSGDGQGALAAAQPALELARELADDRQRALLLSFVAQAKMMLGELEPDERDESLALFKQLKTPTAPLALIWSGAAAAEIGGDVRRGLEYNREALAVASRFSLRWLEAFAQANIAGAAYWLGDWTEAVDLIERLPVEAGAQIAYSRWFLSAAAARIAAARGEVAAAAGHAGEALDLARAAEDPQCVDPALAVAARVAGDEHAVDELLARIREHGHVVPYAVADLAFAVDAMGRQTELLALLDDRPHPSPWLAAARAVAEGRWRDAAELFDHIGALPEAATSWLRAGETVRAAAFFEPRGATASLVAV